jgi:putative phosphoribosyl transferase
MNNIKHREVLIDLVSVQLQGTLTLPQNPGGLVMFAHGSGSSRFSPRNRFVADYLNKASIATLLFDLLTSDEGEEDEVTAELRFNVDMLANRLQAATTWVRGQSDASSLPIGYFGASTGAAAALIAARGREDIKAIVSRGGRPDMADSALKTIKAPTLLIVGGNDRMVIRLNEEAYDLLHREARRMAIVPGATHLFQEPGALEEVARLAVDWFLRYLH